MNQLSSAFKKLTLIQGVTERFYTSKEKKDCNTRHTQNNSRQKILPKK